MSRHDGDATGKESLEWLSKGYQTLAKVEIETVDFPRVNSKAELERQKGLAPKVCDLGHIPETPENAEIIHDMPIRPIGDNDPVPTIEDVMYGFACPISGKRNCTERHIPESEKRQKEPEMGVSVDAKTHPDYPIRHGIPAMDRCICGGVRHWHAVAPYGCDDCECTEFTLNENWRP